MNNALLSDSSGEMVYSTAIPPVLLSYLLKEATPLAVSGGFGDFLFQEIWTPEAVVWYNNYLMADNHPFTNTSKFPKLELQFGLSNSFAYKGEGLGERKLHDGSFNLLYVPSVSNEMRLKSGRIYTTLDLYLTPALLMSLAAHFPVLDDFIGKVIKREASMLCTLNQLTTVEMTTIIDAILKNPFTGSAHAFYVATKVMELLMVVMERITHHPTLKQIFFRDEEIELIYAAKDELLKNLDQHLTLLILSRKVGLNMHKLKEGFQQFYGSSVTVFRLHARMKTAKLLLNTTGDTIEDISYTTGYANSQHFSKAYKKYYGHTPNRVRKDLEIDKKNPF